jgi:hypothetical protein
LVILDSCASPASAGSESSTTCAGGAVVRQEVEPPASPSCGASDAVLTRELRCASEAVTGKADPRPQRGVAGGRQHGRRRRLHDVGLRAGTRRPLARAAGVADRRRAGAVWAP